MIKRNYQEVPLVEMDKEELGFAFAQILDNLPQISLQIKTVMHC
jgi:hypothetical protein